MVRGPDRPIVPHKEKDMRIICDHCGYPVSGAVKKTAGKLNLHPECLVQLGREAHQAFARVSWQSGEQSMSMFERKGTELSLLPGATQRDC
jgi:hypothetical protein